MSETKPTERQLEAIRSIDRSVCVRAGAGTGKTFVLVGRYMELLRRERVSVRSIAALTYTEKAAKEMKDRIRQACVAEEEKCADADERRWWRRQRIDLETAHVGTIHGFCSTLLAEHPVEAGVDPRFTMLDEVEQALLIRRSVDDVLRRRLDEQDARTLVLCRELAPAEVCGMLAQTITFREEMNEAAALIESKNDEEVMEALRQRLKAGLFEHMTHTLGRSAWRDVVETLSKAECSAPEDVIEKRRREALDLCARLSGEQSPERVAELARRLRAAVGSLVGGSKTKWTGDGLAEVKEALKAIREMLDEAPGGALDAKVGEADARSLELTRAMLRLHREAIGAYTQAKAAGGYLDFEDLLLLAREVLRGNDAVRARVQEKVKHLLVDELQDSALIERDILLLIAREEETFRKSGDVRLVPGKLFVVGDDKQSIYRFRGAEVTVFRELAGLMHDQGEVYDLDVNFRTVPHGVAFANDFFGLLLGRAEKTLDYENRYFDLEPRRTEDTSFLEVMAPEGSEDDKTADVRESEARMIATRIRRMVEGKEKIVWDRSAGAFRPAKYGDVAVLFRAMTSSQIYEQALREADVPYYIIAGSGFYRAQEIMDLLTALKALERPRDDVALVGTLRSPLFGITDETLFFMKQAGSVRRGLDAPDSVPNITDDQRRGLAAAAAALRGLAAVKNRVPISRLVEDILRRTGYDALLLAQFMGRQKLANVEKLVDLARTFEAKGLFTLDEFIRYIQEFVQTEARESERAAEEETSDVVRIMSVHRAKGLEFPIVFVADMSRQPRRGDGGLLFDRRLGAAVGVEGEDGSKPVLYDLIRREDRLRDEAENLRLLYVAVTRAQDYLVLSGARTRGKLPDGSWLALLVDKFHLSGEGGAMAAELVFGKDESRAPVDVQEPEADGKESRGRHLSGWKVVKRVSRLAERAKLADRVPAFEGTRRVEPLALDLSFKRRFVASEFTEFRYCPRRYYLSRIRGILPGDLGVTGPASAPGGLMLGTVVHRVLASWDFKSETLDRAAELALSGEGLSGEAAARLGAEAKRLVRSAADAGLFADVASSSLRRSECPIAARVDDFVVEGIVDSLHRLADGSWEIVDYKTDRAEAKDIAELAKHYELQMAGYAAALAKSGVRLSRLSLLFIRPATRHTWTCDEAQIKAWEKLLASCVAEVRAGKFDGRRRGPCRCAHGWICDRETHGGADLDLA